MRIRETLTNTRIRQRINQWESEPANEQIHRFLTCNLPPSHMRRVTFPLIPMTIEDAACVSFRALRFAQGKRSEESERVAQDPSLRSG
ncbi:MAG: hypothetical protein KatS3mg058_4394 [Roseiflexus sp.]|nr:MAG: hypothetical protein KatS3mg058_4394 [Roseiflexus sp.]